MFPRRELHTGDVIQVLSELCEVVSVLPFFLFNITKHFWQHYRQNAFCRKGPMVLQLMQCWQRDCSETVFYLTEIL